MSFISIPAAGDAFPLVATLFRPITATRSIVVIGCATGIPQSFYANFASYIARAGYLVVTFDYRYNGLSFGSDIANFKLLDEATRIKVLKANSHVSLYDFGEKDIKGVLEYVARTWSTCKIYYIGHSVGAHVLPLAGKETLDKIHATMFVSATNPYIGAYKDPELKHGWTIMDDSTNEHGYFDGRAFNFGGLLPSQALKTWKYWATLPGYAAADPRNAKLYTDYTAQVTAVGFTDDVQVSRSPHTIEMWNAALSSASVTLVMVDADTYGLKIGHNDFFRARNAGLWRSLVIDWIAHGHARLHFDEREKL